MGERGGRNTVNEDVIRAFEEAGTPPEEIARLKASAAQRSARERVRQGEHEDEDARIVVEPENADAVRLFRQMQSQWRTEVINTGKRVVIARTGLDYGAIAPVAAALKIELSETAMDGLRMLEAETLAIHMRRQEQLLRAP